MDLRKIKTLIKLVAENERLNKVNSYYLILLVLI